MTQISLFILIVAKQIRIRHYQLLTYVVWLWELNLQVEAERSYHQSALATLEKLYNEVCNHTSCFVFALFFYRDKLCTVLDEYQLPSSGADTIVMICTVFDEYEHISFQYKKYHG